MMIIEESFFSSLQGMNAKDALAACKEQGIKLQEHVETLRQKLAGTPRGDKQAAHEIKAEIARTQRDLKRLKQQKHHYQQAVDRKNEHCMWARAVREVCGQEKLSEVYAWMTANRTRYGK